MEKFAVYVVMVPDSAEEDEALVMASLSAKRIGGNFDWNEAEDAIEAVETVNFEKA